MSRSASLNAVISSYLLNLNPNQLLSYISTRNLYQSIDRAYTQNLNSSLTCSPALPAIDKYHYIIHVVIKMTLEKMTKVIEMI